MKSWVYSELTDTIEELEWRIRLTRLEIAERREELGRATRDTRKYL